MECESIHVKQGQSQAGQSFLHTHYWTLFYALADILCPIQMLAGKHGKPVMFVLPVLHMQASPIEPQCIGQG